MSQLQLPMPNTPLELMASTISEVLSTPTQALFTTGWSPPKYEFTVKLRGDLNKVLRKVCFPIKVPWTGGEDDPVLLPVPGLAQTQYELAQSEFQSNFKSSWHTLPAQLSDEKSTPENDNSQTDSFSNTMILLLAILFKKDVIKLPEQAGHDPLRVEHLLAEGTSVIPHAVDHWLATSNSVSSFNHATFVSRQFAEILESAQFHSRYKVYAHDPDSVALEPTPEIFLGKSGTWYSGAIYVDSHGYYHPETSLTNPPFAGELVVAPMWCSDPTFPVGDNTLWKSSETSLYYVCRNYVYQDTLQNFHHRTSPAVAVVATTEPNPRLCKQVEAGLLGWDAVHVPNRTAEQLQLLSSLNGVSFHLDSGMTLYRIQCFRLSDVHGVDVYVSSEYVSGSTLIQAHPTLFGNNTTVTADGWRWCKKHSNVMGYLPDTKGVLLEQQWYNHEPTQGTHCRYNTEAAPTSYCACPAPVYQVTGGAYYLGPVQAGYDVTDGSTFCFGRLVSDVMGCTDPGFPIGDTTIWTMAGVDPITTWRNPSTNARYGPSDVYEFGAHTFARESRAEVQYVVESANYLGFRQGTWRRPFLPIAALGQAFPQANVLGGQLHLQPGDAVGIVVDMASDSAGLNKTLPLRLLIQQC